jgi:hypothetical protein
MDPNPRAPGWRCEPSLDHRRIRDPSSSVFPVRPAQLDIAIPDFPPDMEWINARIVRLGTLLGRHAVLVWFWDFASLNSLRALPYIAEWDRRYRDHGLRTFGVHSPQFDFGADRDQVARAVERLGIAFAVAVDSAFEIWKAYGNEVWPALYVWDRRGVLRFYHFAEGAYEDAEHAIQELLREIDDQLDLPAPMPPIRETDGPDALVHAPTPHTYLEPDRSARAVAGGERLAVRYAGSAASAVLDGTGEVEVVLDGERHGTVALDGPRLYELVDHGRHEQHELALVFNAPARAYAFSFAPAPVGESA